jgi:succinate-semialdehyde dehydrogenase/glutarate-semialdehyde dehydrogenase
VTIATINPATGETVKTFDAHTDSEVEERLALADEAFGAWRTTSFSERAELVHRLGDVLEGDIDDLARTMVPEGFATTPNTPRACCRTPTSQGRQPNVARM